MGRKEFITGQNLFIALASLLILASVTYFFIEKQDIVIEEIGNTLPGLNSTLKKILGIFVESILS